MDSEASRALIQGDLRQVPASALNHYAFKALSTWGTLDDYRYFLPRLLELASTEELDCDTEIIMGKLGYADWSLWPDDEQAAVREFVGALWCESVRSRQLRRADSILCGFAGSTADIGWLLALSDSIDPGFRILYRHAHGRCDKRKLTNCFWDRHSPSYEQALTWIHAESEDKAG